MQPLDTDSITFTWDALSGYNLNRYEVIVWDQDTEGAFLDGVATTGTSYTFSGLVPGHRYGTWVTSWVILSNGQIGGGPPKSAREILVGQGAPGVVVGVSVTNIDATTVQLTWSSAYGAVGYSIQYQSLLSPGLVVTDGTTTENTYQIAFLFPGTWHYEFCITAYNGNLESACSSYVVPPVYPGYSEKTLVPGDTKNATKRANQARDIDPDFDKLGTIWKLKQQNATAIISQQ